MNATTVVTGLGVAAPNGLGLESYWSAVLAGRGAIGRVGRFDPTSYPAQLAGRSPGSPPRTTCPAGCCPRPIG